MARGSVVKRALKTPVNGVSHSYAIVYYLKNGKQKWEAVGPNKKDAERILAQRISEINNGTYHKSVEITFRDFAQKWFENRPQARVKPSTLRSYKSDIQRHLLPAFGDTVLSQIGQEQVEGFLAKLVTTPQNKKTKTPLNKKTANNLRLTLHMILDYARILKYLPYNPVSDIKPFKVDQKEMDFLNPEEIRKFLAGADEPYKTLFMTAIMTGMRRGEILGLQWGDIDWNSNTIFVRRSLYWLMREENTDGGTRWKFLEPKSKRSKRAIVMSPRLKVALEIHRITAVGGPYDLVFCNTEGNPMDPDHLVGRYFLPSLSRAGLRRIRFHDLRHTYSTLLIAQGENLKFIQSQLGHASIQTTIDRYGHLLPCDQYGVGSKLDGQIFAEIPPKDDLEVENPKAVPGLQSA